MADPCDLCGKLAKCLNVSDLGDLCDECFVEEYPELAPNTDEGDDAKPNR